MRFRLRLGSGLGHIKRRLAVGLADLVALLAGEKRLVSLDLDAEFGALREDFLARELDFLGQCVDTDRFARLARRRRGSDGPRRRSARGLSLSVGIATLLRAIAIAAASAPTAPTTPIASAFAILAAPALRGLAALGLGLVLARILRVVVARIGERVGDARLVLVDLGKIVEAAREDDRGRVGRGRLATATTASAASAALATPFAAPLATPVATPVATPIATLDLLRALVLVLDLVRQARKRGSLRLVRPIKLDIGVALVVGVDVDAVDGDRLADSDADPLAEEILELDHRAALRGEEHRCDLRRAHDLEARDLLHVEHELDAAHRVGRDRVGHADLAVARAVRAIHVVRLADARAHALARELDDAELADLRDGRLGAVAREVLLETVLDVAAMLRRAHVDEVADDDAAEVAQAQLARDLVDGLLVGLVRVRLAVAGAARAARVHIDRDERLGLVDDKRATRRQRHLARMDRVDLALDIERMEDRHAAVVEVHLGRRLRRDDLEEGLRAVERGLAVDHDAVDRRIDRVADGAQEDVALGVELAGRADRVHALLHHLPEAGEVLRVAGELAAGRVESGGPQDEPEALGQVERVEDLPHLAAALLVVDLARDADIVHVGHHHEQAAGDREVACDGRALRAEALLEDLHRDLLAAAERVLHHRTRTARDLAADLLGALGRVALAAREVLRVEVGDVEEAVRAFAEVDERGLDRGLHVDDARLVDRADIRRGRGALAVELRELALLEDRDAHLVAGDIVDDHELLRLLALDHHGLVAVDRRLVRGLVEVAHRGARVGGRRLVGVGGRFLRLELERRALFLAQFGLGSVGDFIEDADARRRIVVGRESVRGRIEIDRHIAVRAVEGVALGLAGRREALRGAVRAGVSIAGVSILVLHVVVLVAVVLRAVDLHDSFASLARCQGARPCARRAPGRATHGVARSAPL